MSMWLPYILVGVGGFVGANARFETHALLEDGSWLLATTNMFASLFVGLIALRAGVVVAKTWLT